MPNPKRNPQSPWNPAYSASLTPDEYERQVIAWLRSIARPPEDFEVTHLKHLRGTGGDYEFDAVVDFSILQGAQVCVLVECKRYSQPVEREKMLSLWAKLQDVKAHKAIMFATCGFQSGALEFAASHGIATVTFVEGSFLYETKGVGIDTAPPPWARLPRYAGIFICRTQEGTIHSGVVDWEHPEPLFDWLQS